MPKNELIGGSLWEAYSKKVAARMDNPVNRGELTEADARKLGGRLVVADHGAESCGDAVRLYWVVDDKTSVIKAARFKSFGCGTAIASSDMMADLCVGRTVAEAAKITNIDVERALRDEPGTPAVPQQKMHCSVMAYDVIKKAVALYQGVDLSSLETETIVCECGRVSLGTIVDAIRLNDLKTVADITHYTKAGGFCKSCIAPGGHEKRQHYLVDILRDTRAAMEKENLHKRMETEDFASMTMVRKLKAVEKVFTEQLRPMLAADGGSIELLGVDEKSGTVKVRLTGACGCCPHATMTLKHVVERMIKEDVPEVKEIVVG